MVLKHFIYKKNTKNQQSKTYVKFEELGREMKYKWDIPLQVLE